MKIISINDILHKKLNVGSQVIVQGWVRTRRDSKAKISFLTIYDGSCFSSLQIIIKNTISNYYTDVLSLTSGCSVQITGKIVKSLGSKQYFEMQAVIVEVLGRVNNPDTYPISAKQHSMKHLRGVAHLRPRTNLIGSIARIRHTLLQAMHRYMDMQGFFWVTTPIITSSDTEGASKMFRVSTLDLSNLSNRSCKIDYKKDFFGKETFLTVSGQLNGECYACALSKIYTFGPTFRAENSSTSRHLAEFWMLEPEMAFANLKDISFFAVSLLKNIFKVILDKCTADIEFLVEKIDRNIINRLENFIDRDCTLISYTKIIDILRNSELQSINQIVWGQDFSSEHERFLTEKYFQSPVIITDYPKEIKAFYMRLNNDFKTVAAMDLLVPLVGELIGGSQREERLNVLDIRLEEFGLNKDDYYWYRDLRRYGTVPHSGFGLGFERLILYITGVQNIKDVIPFPRYPCSINF
ncbi:asparagine--tRNA ligase [Blochmannia endosymbiont of Colobopsis nipponica]|uniref:asparagine--tRNA ligase n=1 Tax=Blochmannia endosymbiont of Colobopsis nipponica TaxID=2681987 RepID=UPI0017814DC1|nr:asparagine--tRNA ligase [Blochmannia endosymbiont of Colobopsis nipponica]QOI11035.1 asparagine--tRNA ligase [Blochmannia endosymbiont of Colobopsis nipponica]